VIVTRDPPAVSVTRNGVMLFLSDSAVFELPGVLVGLGSGDVGVTFELFVVFAESDSGGVMLIFKLFVVPVGLG
jgi:hypothetical protein